MSAPDDDAPSAQLHRELRAATARALATRRPVLHHLNADTSWLLQIPRPASAVKRGARIYYNVLIDPWLRGGQSDVARWFSQQWHATESAVGTVAEVDELAGEMEVLAGGRRRRGGEEGEGEGEGTLIDAVAVSHEFTDHCHRETLLEVDGDVPVFATEQAAKLISSWNHFRTVITTPTFSAENPDWRSYSLPPLPSWLSISRLTATGDALYYHSALLITFAPHASSPAPSRKRASLSIFGEADSSFDSEPAECIVYTPHGIPYRSLSPVAQADPPLQTLAFLHGLHDVSISAAQQLNLGAKNGVLAQRVLGARYWVGTHDEVKTGGGLVSWFLRRRVWTVGEALRDAGEDFGDVRFEEVGNGEGRVLE